MFNYNLLYFLIFSVVCSYCGEDFAVLGRHQWRCKKRMPSSSGPKKSFNIVVDSTRNPISMTNVVTCCCGKACKGTKGLKMHRRRCRTIEGLSEETPTVMSNSNSDAQSSLDNNEEINQSFLCVDKKRGIHLPKSDDQWTLTNDFFKTIFADIDFESYSIDFNDTIRYINETIYNYFKQNYGTVSTFVDQELVAKYKNHSVQSLKKALMQLKNNSAPLAEIQHVSHLLRSTLRSTSNQSTRFSILHKQLDQFISKNFWGFVKTVLDKPSKILPSFPKENCIHYFSKIFSSTWPNRKCIIPRWIPSLQKPTIPFNFEPPSYEKVTNVI